MKKTLALLGLFSSLSSSALVLEKTITLDNNEGEVISTLAHPSGLSLYVFDPDLSNPGGSNCNGTCAEKWPPFIVNQEEAAELEEPLGVATRDNNLLQLTINGRPVYLFYLDRTSEDAKGEGLGSVWHIVR